ncbi:hypothetical protein B0H19DRAFT_1371445 [Mycena capillaripes]|nr:hypothetical protein B0H19DRAFT_1371445 [Mycena capillaripes]
MDESQLPSFLPIELECAIFEIAAHSRPSSIPTLMLVAWRVKIWVEPLLYRTITICYRDLQQLEGHPVFPMNRILQPMPFPRPLVHHLFLSRMPIEDAMVLLAGCRNIDNLWINDTGMGKLFLFVADLPLTHLYCNVEDLFGPERPIDFNHRIFSRITHLEIFDSSLLHSLNPDSWVALDCIPHLTHLAFNDDAIVGIWPTLLRTCKSLRVLVVLDPESLSDLAEHEDERELAKDCRFVVMACSFETKDWIMGAHTGIDYWSRAEDFIAKRRSGQINSLQYTLEGDESRYLR